MSLIKRAQEAASQAAAAAASTATSKATDPATAERLNRGIASAGAGAREAVGMARRGMTSVIEKLDPGALAELIVKTTALQEMTNRSLRAKGSPYRISEISISASNPPSVSFAIGRLDEEPATTDGDAALSELVDLPTDPGFSAVEDDAWGEVLTGDRLAVPAGSLAPA